MAIVVAVSWGHIGASTLAGAALILLFVPLQSKFDEIDLEIEYFFSLYIVPGWIGRVFSRLRLETAGKTDRRIRLMDEIIKGIKVIKMYAWEFSFGDLVDEARKCEQHMLIS